ncbi:hypothetical protein KBI33_03480 [Candidatus Shapirobacteria bacterium]|nr:hypothetical protein [Candidatus Shapirobacteria bacterium]
MGKIKKTLLFFFFFQLILLLAFILSQRLPKQAESYWGAGFGEELDKPLIWSRANFDGFHYLNIARGGYGYLQEAFFPLFPLLIRFLAPFFRGYLNAGFFLANFAFLLMIYAFQLLIETNKEKSINRLLLIFLFFPTSFYFACLYNESLFLSFVFLSFFQAKKGKWLRAGIWAAFASATRVVGVFMLPALLVEFLEQNHWQLDSLFKKENGKKLAAIAISSLGFISYAVYLKIRTGDWLRFASVQAGFGAQRTTTKLILLPQVFWRYLKMITIVNPHQYLYFNVWFEFLVACLFLVLLFLGWWKRKGYQIPASFLTFASFSYLLPALTGTFSSLPRYVLVCFPAFMVLEKLLSQKWLFRVYLIFSTLGMILLAAFFFRGYWVA